MLPSSPRHVVGFQGPRGVQPVERFDERLRDLALPLLDAPAERAEEALRDSLESLTRILRVDACGLARFTDEARSLPLTHAFALPGIPAWSAVDFAVQLPWLTALVREGRTVALARIPDDLPPEASTDRRHAAALGLRSQLVLPLKAGGAVLGFLGVLNFRSWHAWPPEMVSGLEALASGLANAMARMSAEERLRAAEERSRSAAAEIAGLKADVARRDREAIVLDASAESDLEEGRAAGFDEIVGTSGALSRILKEIEQVAAADSPVLILGETGTGKDLVARAIHDRSRRKGRPLVAVNCAALPDGLIESELFGYERGAFTGAVTRTFGRFEVASAGSILLDEVGELPLAAQAKLLRVLDGGGFERLGSAKTVRVDVRIIAATNRDLEKDVSEGRFRADLYYRLNVLRLSVPPLRERPEDIPLLVWHFIASRQAEMGRKIERIPDPLMRAFVRYAWPGNVRQLENVIERALIYSSGPVLAADASFLEAVDRRPSGATGTALHDVERAHIQAVLRACGWKVAGRGNAADRLGVKRSTLQFRMKKLGILRPQMDA